jgi:hypothetical protein
MEEPVRLDTVLFDVLPLLACAQLYDLSVV